jgi:hypothetical protein
MTFSATLLARIFYYDDYNLRNKRVKTTILIFYWHPVTEWLRFKSRKNNQ